MTKLKSHLLWSWDIDFAYLAGGLGVNLQFCKKKNHLTKSVSKTCPPSIQLVIWTGFCLSFECGCVLPCKIPRWTPVTVASLAPVWILLSGSSETQTELCPVGALLVHGHPDRIRWIPAIGAGAVPMYIAAWERNLAVGWASGLQSRHWDQEVRWELHTVWHVTSRQSQNS